MANTIIQNRTWLARPGGAAHPQPLVVSLAYREVLVLKGDRRGARLTAGPAPVWLTQEGDPDDHLLRPGECFTVNRAGRVVLQGMRGDAS